MSDDEYSCDVGYCQLAEVSNYAKELEAERDALAGCSRRLTLGGFGPHPYHGRLT